MKMARIFGSLKVALAVLNLNLVAMANHLH